MNQPETIGTVVIALAAILGLTAAIVKPFIKLTDAINRLVTSVELLKQIIEVFKEMFDKQEEVNDEVDMRLDKIESDLKDFKHHCNKVHHIKVREP